MTKTTYVIDGNLFSNRREFGELFSKVVLRDYMFGPELNLDAFNDVLRGGFGTPDAGFVLIWRNATISRRALGYPETINYLENILTICHPTNRDRVRERIRMAKLDLGPSLFDEIVEIIRIHGPGGRESEDAVELIIED